jgi:uncharacterized membrane protein YadS
MLDRNTLTERQSEDQSVIPIRRRVGKVVLMTGVFLIASLVILGVCVSFVAAYTGSTGLDQGYLNIAIPGFVIGFLLMIVGLTAFLLPEGLSEDGLWIIKTGPYIR